MQVLASFTSGCICEFIIVFFVTSNGIEVVCFLK